MLSLACCSGGARTSLSGQVKLKLASVAMCLLVSQALNAGGMWRGGEKVVGLKPLNLTPNPTLVLCIFLSIQLKDTLVLCIFLSIQLKDNHCWQLPGYST